MKHHVLQINGQIKHENCQPVGAFKVRGGINLVSTLSADERKAGILGCSTGNHGQSLAFAARRYAPPVRTHPRYTDVFSDALVRAAARDPRIVAITAGMPTGTGLSKFLGRTCFINVGGRCLLSEIISTVKSSKVKLASNSPGFRHGPSRTVVDWALQIWMMWLKPEAIAA